MTWWNRVRLTPFLLTVPALLVAQTQTQRPASDVPVFDRETPDRYAADVPAHIAIVDGVATLVREGRRQTAEENTPLLAGDRVRTERGRVEVLYEDGSVIDVDQFSTLDLISDSILRLMAGRIRVSLTKVPQLPFEYRVDLAGVSAVIQDTGEYRISIKDARDVAPEVELTVLRGLAELETPLGRSRVRSGQQVSATATSVPAVPRFANVSSIDEFDRWAEDQRNARLGVDSSRYLPEEVATYGGTFDSAGYWDYMPEYGQVWYPYVATDWHPYSVGQWSYYGAYGWTWVGGPRWNWPTHHYGRWGYGANKWYWIPGHNWGPAWVSWGHTPSYVSWCPLGYNGRPVFGLVSGGQRYDPWLGWTVVPAQSFRSNFFVSNYVVARQTMSQATWSQFVVRDIGPSVPAVAPAGVRQPPIRSPSVRGQAVPRSGGGPFGATSQPGTTPQWRSTVGPDGVTRVSPVSTSPSRVPPASTTAPITRPPRDSRPSTSTQGQAVSRVAPTTTSPVEERNRPVIPEGTVVDPAANLPVREISPPQRPSRIPPPTTTPPTYNAPPSYNPPARTNEPPPSSSNDERTVGVAVPRSTRTPPPTAPPDYDRTAPSRTYRPSPPPPPAPSAPPPSRVTPRTETPPPPPPAAANPKSSAPPPSTPPPTSTTGKTVGRGGKGGGT